MRRILTAILGVLIVAVGALDIMLVLPDITFGKGAGKTPGELSSPIVKLTTVSDFEAENEGTSKIKLNWMRYTQRAESSMMTYLSILKYLISILI